MSGEYMEQNLHNLQLPVSIWKIIPTLFYPAVTYLSFVSTCTDSLSLLLAPWACVRPPLSLSTARECKIFELFVAWVVQKVCSGNSPFSHILCSFFFGYLPICRSSRMVKAKQNVPNFSAGMSIESRLTTWTEATRMLPSLTRRRTKAAATAEKYQVLR